MGKNIALYFIIGLLLVSIFNLFRVETDPQRRMVDVSQTDDTSSEPLSSGAQTYRSTKIAFSVFVDNVKGGKVSEVFIVGQRAIGVFKDGSRFETIVPQQYFGLVDFLLKHDVYISTEIYNSGGSSLGDVLISWFPMLLLIGVWIFFMRQMQGGGGSRALGFGKSPARLLKENKHWVTFADVAGVEEAKEELQEVVDYLKNPKKFLDLGAKIPRGCLLVGSPGTGKTLLARAVAGEAGVPFFTISGSDFVEMFVGVGASRVRDMFEQGQKNAPCIIFIDEIDAVGRHRGAGLGGGNDEREQTLNQLLVEMDGFSSSEAVIIIAATNRPDVLDPALLRPGRFDRQIVVPNPDVRGREAILKVHMKNIPCAKDVKPNIIARGTPGFSGADLANLVNEAALLAARKNKKSVTMEHFEASKDRVMMGTERRSILMTDDDKKLTAYHEAGHALVMLKTKGHEPLHKVTIIPRGRALGLTMWLPERDKYGHKKLELKAQLASLFGGRVAEEIIFGPDSITTGAASDIAQATKLARAMVTQYGFSDALGPLRFDENEGEVFLGHSVTQRKNISDATAKLIDAEIRALVIEGQEEARRILQEDQESLHRIAKGLIEHETLSADDVLNLIKGEPIAPRESSEDDKGNHDTAHPAVPNVEPEAPLPESFSEV